MVALTAVMSGDQFSGCDDALPPRHRERALSLACKILPQGRSFCSPSGAAEQKVLHIFFLYATGTVR